MSESQAAPSSNGDRPPWQRARPWSVAAVAAAAAAGVALLLRQRDYGLLGYDSYPIVLTSRVTALRDVLGNFTEPLMEGLYPARFYRPLLNWSFALDHAVWGLDAFGYQLTNVVLFVLAALALAALAGRLAGSRRVAPLAALIAFLVHPTHVEVLPVPARRPELLACLFLALALFLQLDARALGSSRPRWLPAVATLLAIASKETGFVAVPLVFVAVLAYSDRSGWARRIRHAATALVPHAAAAALLLVVRIAILGGVGGHVDVSLVEFARGTFLTLFTVAGWLVAPQPVMTSSAWGLALLGAFLVATSASALLWTARERPEDAISRTMTRIGCGLAVSLAWIVALDLIYGAAGWLDTWYALLPVAGWSLLVGILAEAGVALVRGGDRAIRATAPVALVTLGLVLVWHASYSPVFRHYEEWERATMLARGFFEETGRRIDAAAPQSVVDAAVMPVRIRPQLNRPTVFGAAVLADHTVQAWAELTRPERRVVVARSLDPSLRPGPGQILLRMAERVELH